MKTTTPAQSKCDYGNEHPVEKPMSITERLFLTGVIIVALAICIVCSWRSA